MRGSTVALFFSKCISQVGFIALCDITMGGVPELYVMAHVLNSGAVNEVKGVLETV